MSHPTFTIEVQRWQVMGALAFMSKIAAPNAFLIGKIRTKIENLLQAFPSADRFRLTGEAITDSREQDRESSEEQAANPTR